MSHPALVKNQVQNPYPQSDSERREMWEMLVNRDFVAFVTSDWSLVADDFWADRFYGIDARKSPDPKDWVIGFPTLDSYRDEWLRQAAHFAEVRFAEVDKLDFLFDCARLARIDIAGDRALAHKKFNGVAKTVGGQKFELHFQSLFQLIRLNGQWRVAGFVGYLPNPMGAKT